MPTKVKSARAKMAAKKTGASKIDAQAVLQELKSKGSRHRRDQMAPRYGIHTDKAFGVSMSDMLKLAKRLGRSHELAAALWDTGWYEARMLASLVDEPDCVTPAQMDRWCRDFDNWGICDTLCFHRCDDGIHILLHERNGRFGSRLAPRLHTEAHHGDIGRSRNFAIAGNGRRVRRAIAL